jgi:hypothetical protein
MNRIKRITGLTGLIHLSASDLKIAQKYLNSSILNEPNFVIIELFFNVAILSTLIIEFVLRLFKLLGYKNISVSVRKLGTTELIADNIKS